MSNPNRLKLSEYRRATMLTRECTGFDSFARLLVAQSGRPAGFRPLLHTEVRPWRFRPTSLGAQQRIELDQCRRNRELADLYDRAQQERGDVRRAVRI